MYLAIVPASGDVRPNTNTAMAFIERHGLKSKTFGVFSKCDQVTDPDVLRSLITGCDTEDGESAVDMGAVHLEKGWVASMLKKPTSGGDGGRGTSAAAKSSSTLKYFETAHNGVATSELPSTYFDTHNIERLYVQKAREKVFFTHEEADPVLLGLHASGHAGVGSLVSRIEREYHAYLNSTWRVNAMEKILSKLDEKTFDLHLIGGGGSGGGYQGQAPGEAEEEQQAAADAEMDRRLIILDEIFGNFQSVFLRQKVHEKLAAVLTETRENSAFYFELMRARGGGAGSLADNVYAVRAKDCEDIVGVIKACFDAIISNAVAELKPFWMETLRTTITAQAQVKVLPQGSGGAFKTFSLSIPWLKGDFFDCLQQKFVSMRLLHKAVEQKPLFQPSNYNDYTEAVLKKMNDVFTLVQERLVETTSDMCRQFFDSRVPARPDVFSIMCTPDCSPTEMAITCDDDALCRHIVTAFVRGVSEVYKELKHAHRGVPLGFESETVAERRAGLQEEIAEIERARDGLCAALNITAEEMQKMREDLDATAVKKENHLTSTTSLSA